MESEEHMIFTNGFGSVTDKRIILAFKNGNEDIPIRQVSSIAFKRKRKTVLATIYFIVCIAIIVFIAMQESIMPLMMIVVGILFLLFLLTGIAQYLGHHEIIISTAGKDRKPIKVEMSKTREGRQFVDAIRRQIIKVSG